MQAVELGGAERHDGPGTELAVGMAKAVLGLVQALIGVPSLLFLAALTAMLLRPPDVPFFEIDRVAFGVLVVGWQGRH